MDLELGDDPPDVMTAAEAEKKLLGTHKEESILTVVTTEERKEEEDIDIPEEYQPVKSLSVGEIKVASEGSPGTKEITKKVTKENGNPVSETILEESVVEEPEEKVILAGTKLPASYQSSFMRIRIFRMMKTPYTGNCSVLSPAGSLRPALVRAGQSASWIDIALPQGSEIRAQITGTYTSPEQMEAMEISSK